MSYEFNVEDMFDVEDIYPESHVESGSSRRINPWLALSDRFRALWESAQDGKVNRSVRQSKVFTVKVPHDTDEHKSPEDLDAFTMREIRAAASKALDNKLVSVYRNAKPRYLIVDGKTATMDIPRTDENGAEMHDAETDALITKTVAVRLYSLFIGERPAPVTETVPDVATSDADTPADTVTEPPAIPATSAKPRARK